jgi:hypothetical protein
MNPSRVRVRHGARGMWEIVLPERGERLTCSTLQDASREAYRRASDRRPCEVIVHDAYHRVLRHELIDGQA